MRIAKIIATTLTVLIAMTSCAINPNLNQVNSAKMERNARQDGLVRAASNSTVASRPTEYLLGFGDVIEVKFFANSEYNEVVAVRPDGKISLQRVGDISGVGMPVSELDKIITKTYSEILVNPDVTVFVREFGGQQVYVMGEVNNPGAYTISKGMSLLRAITTAGGPLNTARLNSVILVRADQNQNIYAERVDLSPSNLKSLLEQDKAIQPYDLIYVPKSFVADLEAFVSQIYKVVMPPLDLAARYKYYGSFAR